MAQRRFHYEQAFEHYLRANRVPYVAVDEARKALLPLGTTSGGAGATPAIKSFDFVVYAPDRNLLLDVKGRQYAGGGRRMENWVTCDDVDGLSRWAELFGPSFEATFVFAYWCREQPPDALFEEVFCHGERWYALRESTLADYRRVMRPRSSRWGTMDVPTSEFGRISRPFSVRGVPLSAGALGGGLHAAPCGEGAPVLC